MTISLDARIKALDNCQEITSRVGSVGDRPERQVNYGISTGGQLELRGWRGPRDVARQAAARIPRPQER